VGRKERGAADNTMYVKRTEGNQQLQTTTNNNNNNNNKYVV
jgi:hypothetical protein